VSSKAGFVKSVPDSCFEEADVGGHDILNDHLEAAPGKPEHQLELSTKQWSITKIISLNAGKRLIMSKHPSTAPWQLPVIYLHLIVLLLIITKCSNGGSPMEYSQKELDVVHGVFNGNSNGGGGCNGNGATGQLRRA
jgi:hypothetical protein